eukprot:9414019-Alexandrium_andersonii.AAC.1
MHACVAHVFEQIVEHIANSSWKYMLHSQYFPAKQALASQAKALCIRTHMPMMYLLTICFEQWAACRPFLVEAPALDIRPTQSSLQ